MQSLHKVAELLNSFRGMKLKNFMQILHTTMTGDELFRRLKNCTKRTLIFNPIVPDFDEEDCHEVVRKPYVLAGCYGSSKGKRARNEKLQSSSCSGCCSDVQWVVCLDEYGIIKKSSDAEYWQPVSSDCKGM